MLRQARAYRDGEPRQAAPCRRRSPLAVKAMAAEPPRAEPAPAARRRRAPATRSEEYYQTKSTIFGALIEAIDLSQLSKLDNDARARKSATSSTRSSR